MDILTRIDEQKAELDRLLPLTSAQRKVLDDKFRLEWNFHSNHLEGNTLTYGETRLLLFFGKTTGHHEKREYDEMEAHDVAIRLVEQWANDPTREITETDLRQLNQIILVRPFWKEAITQDGQPTRKEVKPGAYKTTPNSVRLKNGQIHEYPSPENTPILMAELMDEYNKFKDHPVLKATWAHHRLVAIHPFDDGNGRVARLLANFILLRAGYPPLIVRTQNKDKYLTALQIADTGDLVPFVEFIGLELMWALDISKRAASNESVEEEGDLEKEIELLKTRLSSKESLVSKTSESIKTIWKTSIKPLYNTIADRLSQFDDLFEIKRVQFIFDNNNFSKLDQLEEESASHWFEAVLHNPNIRVSLLNKFSIEFSWKGFKADGPNVFDTWTSMEVLLDHFTWSIKLPSTHSKEFVKRYSDVLSEEEINEISKHLAKGVLNQIKNRTSLKN